MKHPPIPPNCPIEVGGPTMNGEPILIVTVDGFKTFHGSWEGFRKIIAAVARCFWIDERKRLNAIHGGTNDERSKRIFDRVLCDDYAEAWKKWGENA